MTTEPVIEIDSDDGEPDVIVEVCRLSVNAVAGVASRVKFRGRLCLKKRKAEEDKNLAALDEGKKQKHAEKKVPPKASCRREQGKDPVPKEEMLIAGNKKEVLLVAEETEECQQEDSGSIQVGEENPLESLEVRVEQKVRNPTRKRKASSMKGELPVPIVKENVEAPPHSRKFAASMTLKRGAPKLQPVSAPDNDDDDFAEEPPVIDLDSEEEEQEENCKGKETVPHRKADKMSVEAYFCGKPIPSAKAKQRWPQRYQKGEPGAEDGTPHCAEHYEEAVVDGVHYNIGDCVTVNGDGCEYLGRILELFRTVTKENWFRVQWFFRLGDTSIGNLENIPVDKKRVFSSEMEDDNYLACITGKINVIQIPPSDNFLKKGQTIAPCDYYYDMGYRYELSTFHSLPSERETSSEEASSVCNEVEGVSLQSGSKGESDTCSERRSTSKAELTLLDLYSGCGGMSTGLSMGSALAGVNLVAKWALDLNEHACASMKHNHPETEVRNEDAETFLNLLKEWQRLCTKYQHSLPDEDDEDNADDSGSGDLEEGVYEVEKVIDIRMAEINKSKKQDTSSKTPQKASKKQLEFKVHWKGYAHEYDTWEPAENLDCQNRIRDFVLEGRRKRILPLPGDVDVICGGPPCQGASGFNRFRNKIAPLECSRNRQMVIYMDIVEFLKPRFVLMENVVDILKFCGGILGRYAMFRLVNMHYQAKLGLMVAGSYGLPQFRMRVFLWGAAPSEKLPPFPLPTHHVVFRGAVPNEFSRNVVKHADESIELENALRLQDAISDLPSVENSEKRNEISYDEEPKTTFQHYIRCSKEVLYGGSPKKYGRNQLLHDHRPLQLNEDDYQRTCRIPKRKGANFRDLGGLKVRDDNTVELDLDVEREHLPSGKPLVPDYAISFVKGKSLKPFARLWWDETVPTVVTRAEPHNQQILHPLQDRVLTIRENARLQGFPDCYKLFGPVKERYIQIGNAVAVPVARALGYSLALATQGSCKEPLLELPKGFPRL